MKKGLIIGGVILALVVGLGAAGLAYAQTQTPGRGGYGGGMMGGRGGMMQRGGMMGGRGSGEWTPGPMHTYFVEALAEALDLTPEVIQERLNDGETPLEIASSTGLTGEQVTALLAETHNTALDQAVAAGAITQEQADWMRDHMQQRWANGGGAGPCHGGGWNR